MTELTTTGDLELSALTTLADAVLMPCFDGTAAPEWLLRRVSESIGSVCLFARNIGTPAQVRALTDQLRSARPDIVIAIDEEAGDVTRLEAATGSRFPGNAALGRVDDIRLTRAIGYQVGIALRIAGITLNFAPCADTAGQLDSPVIGTRAFGVDPALVARHTAAYITGQQSAGVAACAKHFPGHGDTGTDTHHELAILDGDLARLTERALPPFRAAIDAGVLSIMAGHLLVPAVDPLPASVSPRWLSEILRREMGFDGLIATDAIEMRALADRYGIAEAAVMALVAGADLLCLGGQTRDDDELTAIAQHIADAVIDGRLDRARLADAARRVRALGRTRPAGPLSPIPAGADPDASGTVARRALDVAGPLPAWVAPVLVLRCQDARNIAVGDIPWGPRTVLPDLDECELRVGDPLPADDIISAGTVLIVTRDRHRHAWMQQAVAALRVIRPDAVLIEAGVTGVRGSDAPAVGSYGATVANTLAALGVLGAPGGTTQ